MTPAVAVAVPAVDANAHAVAPLAERAAFPLRGAPRAGTGSSGTEAADAEANGIDDLVAVMEGAGVHQALLFCSRHHGFDSSYVAAALERHPGRFAGVANVDATSPSAVEDVAYWIDKRGLDGVRLWPGDRFLTDERGCVSYLEDPALDRLWRVLASRGIPCNAHKTFPPVLPATRRVLERHEGLRLTVSNLGHVPTGEGLAGEGVGDLLGLAEFPEVYVSFSVDFAAGAATSGTGEWEILDGLLGSYGPGRLLWSPFYPTLRHRTYAESVDLVRRALSFLSGDEQAQILAGSARSLYPCLSARAGSAPASGAGEGR